MHGVAWLGWTRQPTTSVESGESIAAGHTVTRRVGLVAGTVNFLLIARA